MSEFTLMTYNFNDTEVVSAIHWRDISKFLIEHPEAKPFKR